MARPISVSSAASGGIARSRGGSSLAADAVTTALICILVFAVISRIAELIPGLAKIRPILILCVLAIIRIFMVRDKVRFLQITDARIARTYIAFACLAALSITWASWRGGAVKYFYEIYSVGVLFFFLVFKASSSVKVIRAGIQTVIGAGLVLALSGIALGGSGRIQVSMTYDTNDLAMYIACVLPLVFAYWYTAKGMRRLILTAMMGAMALAIILTQSRGGLIAIVCGMLYLVVAGLAKAPAAGAQTPGIKAAAARDSDRLHEQTQLPTKRSFGAILGSLLAMTVILGAVWVVAPAESKERMLTVFSLQDDYNMRADVNEGRINSWKRGLASMQQAPWGVGIGIYQVADIRQGGKYRAAHNSYIQVGVELGVVGLFIYLRMFWLMWRTGRDGLAVAAKSPGSRVHLTYNEVQGLRAMQIVFMVASFFLSVAYTYILLYIIAVFASLEHLNARAQAAAESREASRTRSQES